MPRELIEYHQRLRATTAVAELAHEFGIGEVTATGVCRLARMARGTYYGLFESAAGCLRSSFAEAFAQTFEPATAASEKAGSWLESVQAVIGSLFETIAAKPLMAELCLVHSFGAAKEAQGHDYEAGVEFVRQMLWEGREAAAGGREDGYREPTLFTVEALARMVVSLAALRIQQNEVEKLPEHRDEMVRLVANSFFDPETAAGLWGALAPSHSSPELPLT